MTSLYELTAEYKEAANRLEDLGLDDETIADTLEGMAGDIEEKIKNTAFVIRNIEVSAKAKKEAANAMLEQARAEEKRVERIKSYLISNMASSGISKVSCPFFCVSIKQNPESVIIEKEELVPRNYFREVPASFVLDKLSLKKDMKEGVEVTGALLTRSNRLEIK